MEFKTRKKKIGLKRIGGVDKRIGSIFFFFIIDI